MRRFSMVGLIAMLALLVGCEYWVEVPAGYIGKIITPKGWADEVHESGSEDIGEPVGNEPASRMVLLEVTSNTVKESFSAGVVGKSGQKSEDHRIMIGNAPIAVDVRIRVMVPEKQAVRDDIYTQVTPRNTRTKRVQIITAQMIYDKFAKQDVRSGTRAILCGDYHKFEDINKDMKKANAKLYVMVQDLFKRNSVPLILQNVSISNVKPDETVWKAENQNKAAMAQVKVIREIGKELRKNPDYLTFMKWEKLSEMNAKGVSITIIDGKPGGIVVR